MWPVAGRARLEIQDAAEIGRVATAACAIVVPIGSRTCPDGEISEFQKIGYVEISLDRRCRPLRQPNGRNRSSA
jgi:hypothetical protein